MRSGIAAILFDLDGTLIDSAPDLAAAANDLRLSRGLEPMQYRDLRPHAGSGARGMLGAALHLQPGHADYDIQREAFYLHYERRMLQTTAFFVDVPPVLDALDACGVRWGIVTNKAMRLAEPGARALGLLTRAAALVAGDSTPYTKPHPEPLLEAARRMCQPPGACVYVGDDVRDMQAGRAAGMPTLAAAWGYLGADVGVEEWGAHHVLHHPDELLHWLELA